MPPTPITFCRLCHGRLDPWIDLGPIVPSGFVSPDVGDPLAVPLRAMICRDCTLVQLDRTVPPEDLYQEYWYRSGINEVMRDELADIVEKAALLVGIDRFDTVVDIGANDGTLLAAYEKLGDECPRRIAYEPARNLKEVLLPHCEVLVNDVFGEGYHVKDRKARIITAIAMFYDLDNPKAFVLEIDRILHDDGVWVVQFQDLAQQVATGAVDNICHEHLAYYNVRTFLKTLAGTDLTVSRIERRAINGGSLRFYVQHHAKALQTSMALSPDWVRIQQDDLTWTSWEALERFAWRVQQQRTQLQAAVQEAVDRYGEVDLYAASTKSATLLQYCGFDHQVIRQAAERTSAKWGLITTGTRIPIVSEEQWRQDPAPVTLIGAWQFLQAFLERERDYLQQGGKFLVPLPRVQIVSALPAKEMV